MIEACNTVPEMQWTLRGGNIVSNLNGMCLSAISEPERDKLMTKPYVIGHRGFAAKYILNIS